MPCAANGKLTHHRGANDRFVVPFIDSRGRQNDEPAGGWAVQCSSASNRCAPGNTSACHEFRCSLGNLSFRRTATARISRRHAITSVDLPISPSRSTCKATRLQQASLFYGTCGGTNLSCKKQDGSSSMIADRFHIGRMELPFSLKPISHIICCTANTKAKFKASDPRPPLLPVRCSFYAPPSRSYCCG